MKSSIILLILVGGYFQSTSQITAHVSNVGLKSNQGVYRIVKKTPNTFKKVLYFENTNTYLECNTMLISPLKKDEQIVGPTAPCNEKLVPTPNVGFYSIKTGEAVMFSVKEYEIDRSENNYILTSEKGMKFYLPFKVVDENKELKTILAGDKSYHKPFRVELKSGPSTKQ